MLNTTFLEANLTKDPEVVKAGSNKVTKLRLAYNTYQGKKKDSKPCYVDAEIWGVKGEHVAQNYKKGHPISIEATLDFDTWEDGKKSKVFLKVKEIHSTPKK